MKKLLTITTFFALIASFTVGAIVSPLVGADPAIGGTAFVVTLIVVSPYIYQPGVLNATAGFDLTDINTALGAYCRKFDKEIMAQFFKALQFENFMSKVPNISDEFASPSSTISEILQGYQQEFTPKGTASFDARINKVRQIKVDYQFDNLEELYQSWLCDLAQEGLDRRQWPFVKYVVSKLILPKMIEEMDFNSYNGVYAAPTPSTAGDSDETVDGIDKIIVDEIAGGGIIPITTGAITPSNIVDAVELFVDSIPAPFKNFKTPVFMSATNARLYLRDYRANFGGNNNFDGNEKLFIDGTGKMIAGIDAMEGSDRFIHTNPNNMIVMFDKIDQIANFNTQLDKRIVNLIGDFKRGYGFRRLDTVFVNEQT